jgi:fructose-1,6-bisphosphatase
MAEKLPVLLGTAVEAVKGIDIDRLVVMDAGSGDGVANAANQRINAAYKTLEGLGSALGIDIQQLLQNASKQVEGGDRKQVIRAARSTEARAEDQ